jgi:RHS repeat-associated protein
MYFDGAYGPFGEPYAETGTADLSFTGMNQDTAQNLYDFPAREYNSIHGRWPSPDPSGLASVVSTAPQTLNRDLYVRDNPLATTDPTGLCGGPANAQRPDSPISRNGGGAGCGGDDGSSFGGGCQADGVDTSCGTVTAGLQSGALVQCPNNECEATNIAGSPVYFLATTNGSGAYYTYSGAGSLFYSGNAAGSAAVLNYA